MESDLRLSGCEAIDGIVFRLQFCLFEMFTLAGNPQMAVRSLHATSYMDNHIQVQIKMFLNPDLQVIAERRFCLFLCV